MKMLIARAIFLSGIVFTAAQASDTAAGSSLTFDYNLVRSRAEVQNDAGSQFLLGEMHRRGRLVKQDGAQAEQWYLRAAEQGHSGAQIQLGLAYLRGDGVPRDIAQARRWLQVPAEAGQVEAQYQLGNASRQVGDGAASLNDAIRWYSKAAEQNHPGAQYELGLMIAEGMGVRRNVAAGLFWLNKAADNGHRVARQRADAIVADTRAEPSEVAAPVVEEPETNFREPVATPARHRPARMAKPVVAANKIKTSPTRVAPTRVKFKEPKRVDMPSTGRLMRVATTSSSPTPADNDLDGQFALGVRYLKGEGIGQDVPKGLFWLRKAAGKEHPMALFVLGQLYVAGYGVEKNPQLGARLFREAAKRGVAAAKTALAQMEPQQVQPESSTQEISGDPEGLYSAGMDALGDTGSDRSKQAISSLEGAASHGHVRAQSKLGEIFFQGKRVRRDYDAAFIWYQAAAQSGDAEAQYWLGEMYRQGLGTTRDNAAAAKWFRQAARLGHPMARDRMGGCIVCD